MAIVNICGFETGELTEVSTFTGGTIAVQNSIKRLGNYALQANPVGAATGYVRFDSQSGGDWANLNLATAYYRLYFYFSAPPAAAGTSEQFCSVRTSADALKLSVELADTGRLRIFDSTNTKIADGTTVLSAATWYRIEVKCGTGASAAWEVLINGVSEVSGSADNLTAVNNGYMTIGKYVNRSSNTVGFYYDDMAISNSGYPGAGQCKALIPVANGQYQTFTIGAGSGSHYQIVQTLPPVGNTSYLLSPDVATDAETEIIQTRSQAGINPASVLAVKVCTSVGRDDGVNPTGKMRLISGVSQLDTGTIAFAPSSLLTYNRIFSPPGGGSWTPAKLDGLEAGLVDNANGHKVRLYAVAVMVDYIPRLLAGAYSNSNCGTGF